MPSNSQWKDHPGAGHCDLHYGEWPVLRYMYGVDESTEQKAFDTAKVFHHVYGPGTKDLITKGAGGKFPHHRGLYVGWNKTSYEGKSHDFWHCRKGERLRHITFEEMSVDENSAAMTARIHWVNPDGKVVVEERRTVEVCRSIDR